MGSQRGLGIYTVWTIQTIHTRSLQNPSSKARHPPGVVTPLGSLPCGSSWHCCWSYNHSEPHTHHINSRTPTGTTLDTIRDTLDYTRQVTRRQWAIWRYRVCYAHLGVLTGTKIFGVAALRATWTLALLLFGSATNYLYEPFTSHRDLNLLHLAGILSWCVCLVSTIPDQSIVCDNGYVICGKTAICGISTHPYPSIGIFTSIVGGSDLECSLLLLWLYGQFKYCQCHILISLPYRSTEPS